MEMNKVFGYIRVSDAKQVDGASLSEQKRAIIEYAKKNNFILCRWFEETKTAATRGRPKFDEMMTLLKAREVDGVIMHKIDRSARNLHDWAAVGDLIDNGIKVHFAHESLDLTQRGGRLSADIQAVMASDYIRNLRQETLKGLYGRLNEGIYPFGAPIGYVNNGKGKLKSPHPEYANLVKQIFNSYVSGRHTTESLTLLMRNLGLKNNRGSLITKNGMSKILRNPFYTGLMRVKGILYQGNHRPLIDSRTFNRAQLVLNNRTTSFGLKHNYLFRKKLHCANCKLIMSGEMQKGRIYYRCQTKGCRTKTIREDWVEKYFHNTLRQLALHPTESITLTDIIHEQQKSACQSQNTQVKMLNLKIKKLVIKRERLLDSYLESVLSKEEYQQAQNKLVLELHKIEERKTSLEADKTKIFNDLQGFLELCKNPIKTYDSAIFEEKRSLIDLMTSNFIADQKKVEIITVSPFKQLLFRYNLYSCALKQNRHRKLCNKIIYMDKNTSPVILPPLNLAELKQLFNGLLKNPESLQDLKNISNTYEI